MGGVGEIPIPIVEALQPILRKTYTADPPQHMAIHCAAAEHGGLIKKKKKKKNS